MLCDHATLPPERIVDWPPVVLAVDVTARLDSPLSPDRLLTPTLITLAAPVLAERSTRCAPSVPVTIVAVTPGLFDAELIAAAMPESVLFVESIEIDVDLPPTLSVSVPVPSCCVALNAPEDSVCDVAICVTATE